MAKVEGVDDVIKALKQKGAEANKEVSVVVGYTASYA